MADRRSTHDQEERAFPPNQPAAEPAKNARAMIYDAADTLQSGAALRNRYEDGEFLPGRGTSGRASDRNR